MFWHYIHDDQRKGTLGEDIMKAPSENSINSGDDAYENCVMLIVKMSPYIKIWYQEMLKKWC